MNWLNLEKPKLRSGVSGERRKITPWPRSSRGDEALNNPPPNPGVAAGGRKSRKPFFPRRGAEHAEWRLNLEKPKLRNGVSGERRKITPWPRSSRGDEALNNPPPNPGVAAGGRKSWEPFFPHRGAEHAEKTKAGRTSAGPIVAKSAGGWCRS